MASPVRFILLGCLLAVGTLLPRLARAEGHEQLSIAAAGECPSAADVSQELQQLMPEASLSVSPDVVDSDVIVSDRGAGFTVKVRGQRKRFKEAKRDCMERARHVAVFAVLVIDPLHVPTNTVTDVEEEPEPEKPAETPPPPPPVVHRPATDTGGAHFDLALGPLAQVALRSDVSSSTQAGGLGLRLRYGETVGLTLGLAGMLPTSLHFASADARATWAPLDLGLSLAQRVSSWEVGLDLSVAAAVLVVEGQGQGLDVTQQAIRLEVGGRVGAQVRYWASRHAGVWGGMFVTYFPEPYSLQVDNVGTVGKTPGAWIGGGLGAIIRL